jgi:hypothetical protein
MTIRLKPYQRERIARGPLINYTGPMSEFNNFLESDLAKKTTYNNVVAQIDTKVKKMQAGGAIDKSIYKGSGITYNTATGMPVDPSKEGSTALSAEEFKNVYGDKKAYKKISSAIYGDNKTQPKKDQGFIYKGDSIDAQINQTYKDVYGRTANPDEIKAYRKEFGADGTLSQAEKDDLVNRMKSVPGYKDPRDTTASQKTAQQATDPTKPVKPEADKVEAEKIGFEEDQEVEFTPITAKTATAQQATGAPDVEVTEAKDASKIETTKVADDAREELKTVKAEQGKVSNEAQAQAQTVDATASAVKNVNAAEIDKAVQIDNIPKRKVEAEELVSGSAVKSAEVEQSLAKFQAAQMDLDPMATTQGQLNKLLQDFDAGSPPPWAAAGMRAANAVLNQRGLGASSIAGQAIIQAQMESAIPIAQSDAQTVFNLGIQNLSNRQQRAVLAAQQRAQFLGQEFDQEFQTRVTNAAKVSDIANQNFNAEVQVTLENARMAQSVDLANLNNRQALVMADAAQIANLEMANLNNRQQAAVQNAQAFLQMDMANLQYKQQTNLFKAQEQIKAMFTDAAAENAAAQFNATSENQVNQFYDSLANQTKQFNVQQKNALEQFNTQQSNAISQFNAQQQNAVAQFNASNGLVVSQANAEWRRNIATIDTAAINQANQINAQNAMALTIREYEGMWQEFRDKMQFAHNTSENALDREMQYGIAVMNKDAQIEAAKFAMKGQLYSALGGLAAAGMSNLDIGGLLKKALNMLGGGGGEGEATNTGDPDLTAKGGVSPYGRQDDPFGLDTQTIYDPDTQTSRNVVINDSGNIVYDPRNEQGTGTGVGETFVPTQAEGGTIVDPNTGEVISTGVTT